MKVSCLWNVFFYFCPPFHGSLSDAGTENPAETCSPCTPGIPLYLYFKPNFTFLNGSATLSFQGDPSAPECCIPVRGTPEAVAEASTCLLLSNFLLYCWQVTQSRREQMATSLARGHSLPRWVLEFPSKSGLGAGYAGGTEHPGGAWKKRKPFIATHLVVGWVRGLLLVVTKARGWRHHLCVLCRMQTVSKN